MGLPSTRPRALRPWVAAGFAGMLVSLLAGKILFSDRFDAVIGSLRGVPLTIRECMTSLDLNDGRIVVKYWIANNSGQEVTLVGNHTSCDCLSAANQFPRTLRPVETEKLVYRIALESYENGKPQQVVLYTDSKRQPALVLDVPRGAPAPGTPPSRPEVALVDGAPHE